MSSVSEPSSQIPLALQVDEDATFENYVVSNGNDSKDSNAVVLQSLKWQIEQANEQFIYLWGSAGVGCSHLLKASIHCAKQLGLQTLYLPLREWLQFSPQQCMAQAEDQQLVCIDDIDAVAGKREWEEALFYLFNRIRDNGNRLIIAGKKPPAEIPIMLPDLSSRLAWGIVFYISELSDEDKSIALQQRASAAGIELTAEVAQYIMTRSARDIRTLFTCLDQLDRASLSAQRKLTIPFVRQTFNW